jgi:cytochrome c-type biogenesis protein CcmH/NrfG
MAVQQRYDEALAVYHRALRIVPSDTNVRFLIALTLHNLGRNSEALVQCQLVLQAEPANSNAQALMQAIQRDSGASAQAGRRP